MIKKEDWRNDYAGSGRKLQEILESISGTRLHGAAMALLSFIRTINTVEGATASRLLLIFFEKMMK